jgi:dihydropteroate synthase
MVGILEIKTAEDLRQIMQDIGVDPYGIKIMMPKAQTRLLRINSLSNIAANILKQEMLSLGGDVAVSRDALTGKKKETDCLVMATPAQLNRLKLKLSRQPFGLDRLGSNLSCALSCYQKDKFSLSLGRYRLSLGRRPYIMGIINLTPDSFSGDGLYAKSAEAVCERAGQMLADGADIIDVGGESSRPGARPVALKEELARAIPAVKALAKKLKVPVSIDTCKPEVARQALDNGAVLVNDITGLRSPDMASVVKRYKAGAVVMHMKGTPRMMQDNPEYESLLEEIIEYLRLAIARVQAYGVDKESLIIDPGIGFGKSSGQNLEILKRLKEFKALGRPILVGPSRKSFIGKILNAGPGERVFGTVSSCVLAVENGAHIVRVHDVKEVKQALRVYQAINNA